MYSLCHAQAPLKAAQEVLAAQMKAVMGALGSDAATANKVINDVASLNQARCACARACAGADASLSLLGLEHAAGY